MRLDRRRHGETDTAASHDLVHLFTPRQYLTYRDVGTTEASEDRPREDRRT
jgi:hypothetical protein